MPLYCSPEVSKLELRELRGGLMQQIRDILWMDLVDDQDVYNPDKEWDAGTIEDVASVLENLGLRPAEKDAK